MVDMSALDAASKVVVIRGVGYSPKRRKDNERLAVERDADAIRRIVGFLSDTVPDAKSRALMEWPAVSFVFIAEGEVVEELGLLSNGEWVRARESGDLPLADPSRVLDWLRARGVQLP